MSKTTQEKGRENALRIINDAFDLEHPTRAVLLAIEDDQLTMSNIGADDEALVQIMELAYAFYREQLLPPHLKVETIQ